MSGDVVPIGGSGSRIEVVSRERLSGGFSTATKDRLRIVVNDHGRRVEQIALLKRTSSAVEVSALRAAGQVPSAAAIPRIIDSGADEDGYWVLIPFYSGSSPESETLIPENVVESLARMHVHHLERPLPDDVPVVDSSWWKAKCAVSVERLTALRRPATRTLAARVTAFGDEPHIIDALEELPRTLLHGDVHRNNVLVDEHGTGHLIDWGGALVGTPALDIVNLGPPGSSAYRTYVDTWETLTGQGLDHAAWWRSYLVATVCINVKYVAFAARMFGDHTAESMLRQATEALEKLDTDPEFPLTQGQWRTMRTGGRASA